MEVLQINQYYHIYNHANGDDNLFREEENYRFFLQQYQKYIAAMADTFAYCLMPNHFHFLVRIKSEKELLSAFSKFNFNPDLLGFQNLEGLVSQHFSNLFNSYSKAFNKKYNRKGSLFLKNFKRKEIINTQQLLTCILYINNNPVHHGFTNRFTDWQWISYHSLMDNENNFIPKDELIDLFGTKDGFMQAHCDFEQEKLKRYKETYSEIVIE